MDLTPVERKFVLHWGEMGARWGVNRTVAQVHALLLVSPAPLDAEEIASTLAVARSSVSTGLRELQGWGILRATHRLGDRREYFGTLDDPWEMFRAILAERKAREIDPTLRLLRECRDEAAGGGARGGHARKRFAGLLGFFETVDAWYGRIASLPRTPLLRVLRAGGMLGRIAGGGR
jgi:DNA-binding transcriptional regulator GbsR (MarR family)